MRGKFKEDLMFDKFSPLSETALLCCFVAFNPYEICLGICIGNIYASNQFVITWMNLA